MQPEQLSNALDLENGPDAAADNAIADVSAPIGVAQPCDPVPGATNSMQAPAANGKGVGQLLSIFKTAAEDQANMYRDLNERMDRLEQTEEAANLRETVRELFEVVTGLAGEMGRRISHAEHRIATVAKAVEVLVEKFSSDTDQLKHLNAATHEKLVTLHELLDAAEVRGGLTEAAIAELREGSGKPLAALGVLSKNLESFGDRLSQQETQSAQLGDRLEITEGQIADFAQVESKVESLTTRMTALADVEKSLAELREQGEQTSADFSLLKDRIAQAESGIAASAEQSQSLAKLHASLAETYAPKAG